VYDTKVSIFEKKNALKEKKKRILLKLLTTAAAAATRERDLTRRAAPPLKKILPAKANAPLLIQRALPLPGPGTA